MCGLGAMTSVLSAKLQEILLVHRKPSEKKKQSTNERRRSSQQDRQIPPEPVQERPLGDFNHHEVGPALKMHNMARANRACKKLDWDDRLMRDAETYAQKLARDGTGNLESSGIEDQGENLFMSTGDADLEDAVTSWLSEEKQYNGETIADGKFEEYGHFSKSSNACSYLSQTLTNSYTAQCLWHSTERIGMAKAKSKDGKTFIVARYSPAGNVPGERPF